jgi:hypothetical protein
MIILSLTPFLDRDTLRDMRFSSRDGNVPQPSTRYAEMAAMCRELGLNVADDDYEYIDDVVLRDGLKLLVRE